jgi:hypothetical protein
MPSITTATKPVTSYPFKFASPFGNENFYPLYSSIPIFYPIVGCLECAICSSKLGNEIVQSGALVADIRQPEVKTPTTPVLCNLTSDAPTLTWSYQLPSPNVTISYNFYCAIANSLPYTINYSWFGKLKTGQYVTTTPQNVTLDGAGNFQLVDPSINGNAVFDFDNLKINFNTTAGAIVYSQNLDIVFPSVTPKLTAVFSNTGVNNPYVTLSYTTSKDGAGGTANFTFSGPQIPTQSVIVTLDSSGNYSTYGNKVNNVFLYTMTEFTCEVMLNWYNTKIVTKETFKVP